MYKKLKINVECIVETGENFSMPQMDELISNHFSRVCDYYGLTDWECRQVSVEESDSGWLSNKN